MSNSPILNCTCPSYYFKIVSPKMAAGVGQTVCIVSKENGAVSLQCTVVTVVMAAVVSQLQQYVQ